jgi:tetratricopeptide (TPR) repeat protein
MPEPQQRQPHDEAHESVAAALLRARQAVDAARASNLPRTRLFAALVELTALERQYGTSARAVQAGTEALRLIKPVPAVEAVEVHLWLAQALSELQFDAEALHHAREAFDIARDRSLYRPSVQALMVLGSLHGRMGEHELAHNLMMQALSRARESNDEVLIRSALNNLVLTMTSAEEQRRRTEGTPMPEGSRSMLMVHARRLQMSAAEEPGAYRREAMLCTAGAGLLAADRFDDARALFERCLALAAGEGLPGSELKTWGTMGQYHVRTGDLAAARKAFESGLALAAKVDVPVSVAGLHQELADVCEALGDVEAAQRHAAAAEQLNHLQEQRLNEQRAQIDADRDAVRAGLERLDADLAAGGGTP